jgi:hypothetical protein
MSALAIIRPNDWDFPLFLHIFGATILVGGLVTAVGLQAQTWRKEEPAEVRAFSRWAFLALLMVVLPGWVLMRVGAQWIYSKEGWGVDSDPDWLGIGFTTADIGLPILVVSIILAGLGARQVRSGGSSSILSRIATPLAVFLLVMYLVTVWAMTAKPD